MRLDKRCILLLAGAATALPNDALGAAHVERRAVAIPLMGAIRTATPAVQPKTLDLGNVVNTVKNLDPKAVAGQLKAALENINVQKVWEGLKAAFWGMDFAELVENYTIPIALRGLKELQQFSGERTLQIIGQLKGKDVLAQARRFDMGIVWKLYDALNTEAFAKAALNVDISPIAQQLRSLTAVQILDAVAKMTPQQMANWIMAVLDVFSLGKYLDTYGIDLGAILQHVLPATGGELLKYVEDFDGAAFLQWFGSLTGEEVAVHVNAIVNHVLTKARSVAAVVFKKPTPPAFTDFDLFRVVQLAQNFVQELTGVTFPSVVDEIKGWSGARQLEIIKTVDLKTVVDVAVAAAKVGVDLAVYASGMGLRALQLPGVGGAKQSLLGMVLAVFKGLSGKQLLDYISTLDPKPIVQRITEHGVPELVRRLTSVDLTPYLDALKEFSPATFLGNVGKLKGARVIKLIDDLSITAYMKDFPGVNFNSVRVLLNAASGKVILGMVRAATGEKILKFAGSLFGVDLLAGAASAPRRAGAGAPLKLL